MTDRLIADLAGLRVDAPATLTDSVLVATGLAHGYVLWNGPLGQMAVAFSDRGVTAVRLAAEPAWIDDYEREHGRSLIAAAEPPEGIAHHLDRAVAEGRPGRLPVDLSTLTEFQQAVLRAAATIPRGEVRPYGWVAKEIGKPAAVRAVGSALAHNPVPVIIPCHRVVRSDGSLGEYSLGDASNKRVLLEGEGLDTAAFERLATRGIRFLASDTTKVFCHPTCGHAELITAVHRREFTSEREARAAGYRPCRVCRPVAA
jgi:O-6-methylguanine DNA methyltransferase